MKAVENCELQGYKFNCYELNQKDIIDYELCKFKMVENHSECDSCHQDGCLFKMTSEPNLTKIDTNNMHYYERTCGDGKIIGAPHCGDWPQMARSGSSFLFLSSSASGTGSSLAINSTIMQFAMPEDERVIIKGVSQPIATYEEDIKRKEDNTRIKVIPRKLLSSQDFLDQMSKFA